MKVSRVYPHLLSLFLIFIMPHLKRHMHFIYFLVKRAFFRFSDWSGFTIRQLATVCRNYCEAAAKSLEEESDKESEIIKEIPFIAMRITK